MLRKIIRKSAEIHINFKTGLKLVEEIINERYDPCGKSFIGYIDSIMGMGMVCVSET